VAAGKLLGGKTPDSRGEFEFNMAERLDIRVCHSLPGSPRGKIIKNIGKLLQGFIRGDAGSQNARPDRANASGGNQNGLPSVGEKDCHAAKPSATMARVGWLPAALKWFPVGDSAQCRCQQIRRKRKAY
jgi:hypothetical protein